MMIGGFPSGVKRQYKWINSWKELFSKLETSGSTLCFNWLDPYATTSRYIENYIGRYYSYGMESV